jgi:hypothetical protein
MRNPEELRAAFVGIDKRRGYPHEPEWPAAPWLVVKDGREWSVATDGHVLVAVPRVFVAGECPAAPNKVASLALKWIDRLPVAPVTFHAKTLRNFARVETVTVQCDTCGNKRTVDCETCDGTGTSECECDSCSNVHEAECDECKDGRAPCPDCSAESDEVPAQIINGVFNRHKLRDVLVAVDDDQDIDLAVEPSETKKDAAPLCFLRSSQWMALIMSMSPHVKATERLKLPVTSDAVDPHADIRESGPRA